MTATIVTGSQGLFWRPSAALRVAPGLRSDRRLAAAVLAAICAFTLILAAAPTASSLNLLGTETGVAAQTNPSATGAGAEAPVSPMVVGGNGPYAYDGVSGCCVAPSTGGRIPWTSFDDYPKVTIDGRQYADVGGRPYTQHAVDRMQPSGLGSSGMPGGASGPGRSISPNYVEDVLTSDLTVTKPVTGPLGQARTSHVSGSVEVITEGDIVITIITR